ncbi:CPCC family cysteine-rich protein [uncultured Clostridium sp.]|uniref:CPCC family cysteine-rich protein n=1 Tax=uncultured Clostridium sp. TaxID=59620 RepID=UPI00272C5BDA|nr:CPCC family cysteine-rich protein [uncultured Clostridium sp.]
MDDEFVIKCPVCGEEVELFDICDNCNYQNNGLNESLDEALGANKMTLREAREAYKKGEKII